MAKKKRKNRVPPEVAKIVVERANGHCEMMHYESGCTGHREQLHHRQLRSQGGEHTVENLVGVCHRCHYWLHQHPAIAYARGWLVKSTKNPVDVPFERRGVLSFLEPSGGVQVTDVEPLEV